MEKTKNSKKPRHPASTHERACELRRQGFTHREIVKELGISFGSASLWTKGIIITAEQKAAIQVRKNKRVWTAKLRSQFSEMAKARKFGRRQEYSKEELLRKIRDFYQQNHRIPLKRELNMYKVYQLRFGSWNGAIRAAGFETNPQLFAHKFTALDGHRCDSFTEKIIDDWLYGKGIPHQRNWRYGDTKMTADFFIEPDIVIEFFGLAGVQSKYDEISERKRMFCGERYIQLIEIYPENVFPQSHLSEISDKLEVLLK
jgi:hypothetical protein